jgi:hypothetical protein
MPLLGYMRGLGVAPTPPEPVVSTPSEMLVEEYIRYLVGERGLAVAVSSVERYLGPARLFLSGRKRPGWARLGGPDGKGRDGLRVQPVSRSPCRVGQGDGARLPRTWDHPEDGGSIASPVKDPSHARAIAGVEAV